MENGSECPQTSIEIFLRHSAKYHDFSGSLLTSAHNFGEVGRKIQKKRIITHLRPKVILARPILKNVALN
jgi:hypothetical protein